MVTFSLNRQVARLVGLSVLLILPVAATASSPDKLTSDLDREIRAHPDDPGTVRVIVRLALGADPADLATKHGGRLHALQGLSQGA